MDGFMMKRMAIGRWSLSWGVALVALCLVAVGLSGCATPPAVPGSYVVLLPSPDGQVGQVWVNGPGGQQRLSQAGQAAGADGTPLPQGVPEAVVRSTFAAAQAAQPVLPERFVLYFEFGGTALTPDSEQAIARLIQRVQVRRAQGPVEVDVIGHTDTVGRPQVNAALSLERAQGVARRLAAQGLAEVRLAVGSHGEANLLVPTPDETPEPRNRRVEVTLR